MEWQNTFNKFRYVLVGVVAATVLIGGFAYSQKFTTTTRGENATSPTVSSAPPPSNAMALPDFAQIAAEQGPAVVNVSVTGTVKTALQGLPGFGQMNPDDPFSEFFRRFQAPVPHGSVPTHGQGSGFVVSADGVVLTNAHVVADADEVTVKLTDKREFKAKVVGVDKLSDVAVLRIDAKGLPTVHIGEPKNSRVGEWVVAIGSPFGFENTVTAGIVSAKSRTLPDEGYVPFLQTDVPINPGNSGGPLFNLRGEVIGINSQIYSSNGGYQGLSFAIPIDVAMKVERQLLDTGKVSRGHLGISVQDVSSQVAASLGMDKSTGALVGAVERGSPADTAGIEAGDVIVQFAGTNVNRSGELPPLVSDVTPGSKVPVKVLRSGKTLVFTVTVGEMKSIQAKGTPGTDEPAKLGLAVRPLTDKERSEAGVVSGLMVEEVRAGPAQLAGIQPGDVILSANGNLLSSVEQLQSKVAKSGKDLTVLVLRDNSRLFFPIHLG